jgi:hypothetical protein
MDGYEVKINFDDGDYSYDFPYVYSLDDPQEGMKATVISGIRGSGSIVIPGGKKSQEIVVKGRLLADDYKALTTLMNTMRTSVTTNVATLTLKHNDSGWITDWSRTVRRITEISFPESMRTGVQEYEVRFLQISY